MNKAEMHYLTCLDENCTRALCVDRRNVKDPLLHPIRLTNQIKYAVADIVAIPVVLTVMGIVCVRELFRDWWRGE